MKAYIQRAQEHDEFMRIQEDEYRIGKRHLANMMGEDPETFTQDDVNVSGTELKSTPQQSRGLTYNLRIDCRMFSGPSSICFRPDCTTNVPDP